MSSSYKLNLINKLDLAITSRQYLNIVKKNTLNRTAIAHASFLLDNYHIFGKTLNIEWFKLIETYDEIKRHDNITNYLKIVKNYKKQLIKYIKIYKKCFNIESNIIPDDIIPRILLNLIAKIEYNIYRNQKILIKNNIPLSLKNQSINYILINSMYDNKPSNWIYNNIELYNLNIPKTLIDDLLNFTVINC